MRQKRAKVYRKLLASYIRHFGLRPPLQVLIDAPMALTLAGLKLSPDEVPSRLAAVLQVTGALPSGYKGAPNYHQGGASSSAPSSSSSHLVKLMITQCSITELYKVQREGEREKKAVELAKGWERRFCNHKEAMPGDRCICDVIGDRNKHRYVLAADSAGLRVKIRNEVVGVPVVHANDRNVLVMEPMSEKTKQRCDEMERKKLNLAPDGSSGGKRKSDDGLLLQQEGQAAEATATQAPPGPPKKKRAKGPNPLSMKKSKKTTGATAGGKTSSSSAAPKKKRKMGDGAAAPAPSY